MSRIVIAIAALFLASVAALANMPGTGWILGKGSPEVELTASSSSSTTATSYTFSSQSFGPASSLRYIIVSVTGRSGAGVSISSVTIGGVGATQIVYAKPNTDAANYSHAGIYIAAVPSGTSGSVVVSLTGGSLLRCGIGVYRVDQMSSPSAFSTATDTDASNPQTASISVTSGGFAIGVAYSQNGASWSGLSESYEINMATTGSDTNDATGALSTNTGTSSISVSMTAGLGTRNALAVASWGP